MHSRINLAMGDLYCIFVPIAGEEALLFLRERARRAYPIRAHLVAADEKGAAIAHGGGESFFASEAEAEAAIAQGTFVSELRDELLNNLQLYAHCVGEKPVSLIAFAKWSSKRRGTREWLVERWARELAKEAYPLRILVSARADAAMVAFRKLSNHLRKLGLKDWGGGSDQRDDGTVLRACYSGTSKKQYEKERVRIPAEWKGYPVETEYLGRVSFHSH